MKRRKGPQRNTPLHSSTTSGSPRVKNAARDEVFRAWVKLLPCALWRHPDHECVGKVDPCHVKTKGAGGGDRANLVPMCRGGHDEQHHVGIRTFQKKYGYDMAAHARRVWDRYAGVREL